MLWTILTVVFGVVAIGAYVVGVRRKAAWGTPALVLAVLLAVGAVVARQTRGPGQFKEWKAPSAVRAGEGLKGVVEDGARVFVFRSPSGKEMSNPSLAMKGAPPGYEEGMEKALSQGAGVELKVVGSSVPWGLKAEEFRLPPRVDAWVSMIGMPRAPNGRIAVDQVQAQVRSEPLAAVVRLSMDSPPALPHVRQLLEDGTLTGVLRKEAGKEMLYTKQNAEQLR